MSKHKNNVNPDYYKTAGREPVVRAVMQSIDWQVYAQAIVKEKRNDPRDIAEDLERPSAETKGEGRQRSGKVGKRSPSQKMDSTLHKAGPIPTARPIAGAFGRKNRDNSRRAASAKSRARPGRSSGKSDR